MNDLKEKLTSIGVAKKDSDDLEKFCRKIGCSKKDYIRISLNYFKAYGVDPLKNESPQIEIAKIFKRIEDLFAFGKAQESKIIIPAMKKVEENMQVVKGNFENKGDSKILESILFLTKANLFFLMQNDKNEKVNSVIIQNFQSYVSLFSEHQNKSY